MPCRLIGRKYLAVSQGVSAFPTPAQKPSRWDPILNELEKGEVISIPVESEDQVKGYRIGIARRAALRESETGFRSTDTMIAVSKKSEEPYVPKVKQQTEESGDQPVKRRGRPRKADKSGE